VVIAPDVAAGPPPPQGAIPGEPGPAESPA
jgi:hypothetical protein